ncbi:MAG TPA: LptF/LptG family permease, partial [Bryobacteraceae bacterium]|nr:LptF/LptG family permease [Bryobacteraceae bacterium]
VVLNRLLASELTADVQPRVFAEQFPNKILYVSDVIPGTGAAQWRKIFLADVTPPGEQKPGAAERGDSPAVLLASGAVAIPDVANNRIQLALKDSWIYTVGQGDHYYIEDRPTGDQALQAQRPSAVNPSRPAIEMDTGPLYRLAYGGISSDKTRVLGARIEFQQRLALPLACILLALAGIPLGITARRSGKSSAVVLTVLIAFLYYVGLISVIRLAQQGTLSPEVALWIPNLLFALVGSAMMLRLEAPGDRAAWERIGGIFRSRGRELKERGSGMPGRLPSLSRFPLLVQVVDTYVLSSFLFYFVLWLASFVIMYHVFTFFGLLSDILKNHVSLTRILQYHFFLTARLIYELAPVAVLAAVLVIFGVMAKNNEIIAFKACGISAYRLAAPVLIAGLFLSGSLFAFDYEWVPDADKRQDQIYAEIKGKPAQTFLQPDRKWMWGLHNRVYYYKYFDQAERVMLGVNVYEIDPEAFRLKRHISAERARWEPGLHKWVFQNGWSRDMNGDSVTAYDSFAGGTRTFPELEETPDYFMKQVIQSPQMNFQELQQHIQELQQSGFNTVPLQVQFHDKFSVPLFALILAMVSIPFAFRAGNRGAMAGVGISLIIFIAYWSIRQLFEQVGNVSELPAAVAAWSPDAVFSLAGLYFMARMRT